MLCVFSLGTHKDSQEASGDGLAISGNRTPGAGPGKKVCVCVCVKQSACLSIFDTMYHVIQVDCMEEALERSQDGDAPDLKVSILLDYTRGSRGLSPACSSMR